MTVSDALAYTIRATLGRLLAVIFRTRFLGREKIPAGGAILAGNHVSYLDPMLLWIGYRGARRIRFMAKAELFDKPVLGWGLRRFWAFPVHRGKPDRTAIQTATEALKSGELVGIFPEGTRTRTASGELGEAQGGMAFIAMHANAPIVPVGIANTDKVFPEGARFPRFPRVTIVYCDPICPDEIAGEGRKERMEALTAEMMRRIAQARDEAREAATR
ncbi:MAG: 1-acyl-sn-glycerol-3-phosphate acyltransferase [Coriobacteriales bacterium]|nr:1-acyl-sn-glycerol-3-phosphate acyltransferase [Coriobacteriales bacterium]